MNACGNYTNFSDLNVDCKLLILDDLDFLSLLDMAEVDKESHTLASDVYRRKYASKKIRIFTAPYWLHENVSVHYYTINIKDLKILTRVFKNFAEFISGVHFDYGELGRGRHIHDAMSIVNQYGDNLQTFQFKSLHEEAMNRIIRPFPNVTDVDLAGRADNLISGDKMQLNEIFPKLQSLSLDSLRIFNWEPLAVAFPHLEHLMWITEIKYDSDAKCFEELIRLNPQIKNIGLYTLDEDVFEFIGNNAHNVESLQFERVFWKSSDEVITFKNVRKLRSRSNRSYLRERFNFPALTRLEFNVGLMEQLNEWLNFTRRHTTLRELHIPNIVDGDLFDSIKNIPHIVEAAFFVYTDIPVGSIVGFLQRNENIRKLDLNMYVINDKYRMILAELRKYLKDEEWNISYANNHIVLEKRE